MAQCPKCGHKLKLTDYKPNCPKCGVNIVYYNMDERLQEEADIAELDHVRVQKKIDRLKASFVGSPYSLVRLALSILPLATLMLPLASVTYSGPFIEQKTSSINAVTIVNTVSSLNFDSLFKMTGSKLVGAGFTGYAVSLFAVLISLAMVVVSLVALVAANGKKGNIRNIFNNCVAIAAAVVSIIFFTRFSSGINSAFPEFFSGSVKFGAFVYLAALLALLAINIIITIKKPPVKYKQCYIGGIPYEEYEQMIADGVSMEEIHEKMDKILAEKEAARLEEMNRKAAEKAEKEKEEIARKAGIIKEDEHKD
ncbi:MAG: zinc ribbon domain-containing protein [Clostridia bacterium]|nr:zinc ribbon domain-containing protein [Clostridia bacterium]